MTRLLNAVASSENGRQYLASYDIVPLLFFGENVLGVHNEKPRTDIAQTSAENLMAAAFKISLVVKQRIAMLHRNVPQWTINNLMDMEESPLLTDYYLNSVTSLLLVLLTYKPHLRHGIRESLTLLERYLSHASTQATANISNILIVLMENTYIRAHAKGMGLASAIIDRKSVSFLINC